MERIAYITAPGTIRVINLDTGKQESFIKYTGDDDDATMALNEVGYMTLGNWDRTGHNSEPCIDVTI